jgi:hypothetical protein
VNSYLKYLLLLAAFYVAACEKDSGSEDFFLVEVVGKGMDCGETYLVRMKHYWFYLKFSLSFCQFRGLSII